LWQTNCIFESELSNNFQHSLFLRITTLLTWLKSTLLLKNKFFDTHIYMKTQCLQTNEMQHYCGKENAWGARWVRKEVALIKSLIYARRKNMRLRRVWIWSTKVGWFISWQNRFGKIDPRKHHSNTVQQTSFFKWATRKYLTIERAKCWMITSKY